MKLHDYGCSLKAYRASLVSNLDLYGEMHRFIPVLAVMEGAAISEVEVLQQPKKPTPCSVSVCLCTPFFCIHDLFFQILCCFMLCIVPQAGSSIMLSLL